MKLLRQIKWNLVILSFLFIALGIILILWPNEVMRTSCYMLAAMLIIVGVISLINYLRKDISGILYRYDLVVGLSAVLGGILVIIKVDQLLSLIPVVLGFLVTISGILKMQNSVDMLRLGQGTWYVAFCMAILNIIFGIVLLIDPFSRELLVYLLGAALIFSGITDLYVTISISRRLADLVQENGISVVSEEKD
ncbi:MAG: DUF308 domain-containing protein [Eubacterium sp.]|nr:DUF308 domain-containing protein [Eubacterium sp.]